MYCRFYAGAVRVNPWRLPLLRSLRNAAGTAMASGDERFESPSWVTHPEVSFCARNLEVGVIRSKRSSYLTSARTCQLTCRPT